MLTPRQMRLFHRTVLAAGIALALALALVGPAKARTTVDAMRLVLVPSYSPLPGSATAVGYRCPTASHADGFTRVCAAVHLERDRVGNITARAAGAVAAYDQRGRPLERPLALRVRLVGDPVIRRAYPLATTRRTRRGPARVTTRAQARVLAFEYRGGRWRQYLVHSQPVTVG